MTSTGAGAEMRRAMGVAVFSGMLGVTFFGLLLTPVFYLVIRTLVRPPRGARRECDRADVGTARGALKKLASPLRGRGRAERG